MDEVTENTDTTSAQTKVETTEPKLEDPPKEVPEEDNETSPEEEQPPVD